MTLTISHKYLYAAIIVLIRVLLPAQADVQLNRAKSAQKLADNQISMKMKSKVALKAKTGKTHRSKIGPKLTEALATAKAEGSETALLKLKAAQSVPDDNSRRVSAVVRPDDVNNLQNLRINLVAAGAEVVRTDTESLKINIPLDMLESAAALPEVRTIRALYPPREKAYTAQGVAATLANTWHSQGYTGKGTRIAVVDMGFKSLSTLVANGEIPADYIPVNFSTDPTIESGDNEHGSACAEIVYDIAPDAQLYLIKMDDIIDLVPIVSYCVAQGIDIISFSLGFDMLNFHDGIAYNNWYTGISDHPVTAAVQANQAGILFVVAAGNEQQQYSLINWGSSASELLWSSGGANLNLLYDYDGDTTIPAGRTISVLMSWNLWPTTDQDFDLYLVYNDGSSWSIVASSEDWQIGDSSSYPIEAFDYTTIDSGQYAIYVQRYGGSSIPDFIFRYYGTPFSHYWGYDNTSTTAPGSLSIPGDATAAFTVGAIDYASYPGGPVDYYSSLGPNNRVFTGGTATIKPDVCAPSGVTSVAYENGSFSGTSAATPHVAGLAALVKGIFPQLTVAQLKQYIENNASDIAPSGKDNTSGSGAALLATIISSDALNATAISNADGSTVLQLAGLSGEQYTVLARDSLETGSWQSIGTATIGAGGTAAFTDTGPLPPKRFYKIIKQ